MIKKYDNFFLDRDGIINKIVRRKGQISSPWEFNQFSLLDESKDFIKSLFAYGRNLGLKKTCLTMKFLTLVCSIKFP